MKHPGLTMILHFRVANNLETEKMYHLYRESTSTHQISLLNSASSIRISWLS